LKKLRQKKLGLSRANNRRDKKLLSSAGFAVWAKLRLKHLLSLDQREYSIWGAVDARLSEIIFFRPFS